MAVLKVYHESRPGVLLVSEELFEDLVQHSSMVQEIEISRLKEALKFYADEDSYVYDENYLPVGMSTDSMIFMDCGERARKALEAKIMVEQLCANCKWEVGVVYDHEKTPRCSDCGSEILGHEKGDE